MLALDGGSPFDADIEEEDEGNFEELQSALAAVLCEDPPPAAAWDAGGMRDGGAAELEPSPSLVPEELLQEVKEEGSASGKE